MCSVLIRIRYVWSPVLLDVCPIFPERWRYRCEVWLLRRERNIGHPLLCWVCSVEMEPGSPVACSHELQHQWDSGPLCSLLALIGKCVSQFKAGSTNAKGVTSPLYFWRKRNRKGEKNGKGLRHFSMKVCEKVQRKGTTSYNEVADELVAEFSAADNHILPNESVSMCYTTHLHCTAHCFYLKQLHTCRQVLRRIQRNFSWLTCGYKAPSSPNVFVHGLWLCLSGILSLQKYLLVWPILHRTC